MADDSLTIDIDPKINETELKKDIKHIRSALNELGKNSQGSPGMQKTAKQALEARNTIDKLLKSLDTVATKKTPTKQYEDLKARFAENRKEVDKLGKSIEKLEPQSKDAQKVVKDLQSALDRAKEKPFETDEYKNAQKELASLAKQLDNVHKKMTKSRALGKDRKSGRGRPYTDQYKGYKYDEKAILKQMKPIEKTIAQLEKSGENIRYGDPKEIENITKQLTKAVEEDNRLSEQLADNRGKMSDLDVEATRLTNDIAQMERSGEAFKIGDEEQTENLLRQLEIAKVRGQAVLGTVREIPSAFADATNSTSVFTEAGNRAKEIFRKIVPKDSLLGYTIEGARNDLNNFKNIVTTKMSDAMSSVSSTFDKVRQSLPFRFVQESVHKVTGAFKNIKSTSKNAFGSVKTHANKAGNAIANIRKATKTASNIFSKLKSAAKNAFSGIRKHTEGSKKHLLRSIIQYGFAARSVFFLYRKIRAQFFDSLKALAADVPAFNETMSSLSNTFDQMKNSIATAAQPLVTALAPALEWIMEMAIAAANAIGTFIATLTGQKVIYKTVKGNKSYAESADDAADATGRQSKALDELNEKLGEYDKLSVIGEEDNKNKASTGGSGGGAGDDGGTHFVAETIDANSFAQQLRDAWNAEDWEGLGELIGGKINEIVAKIDEAIKWENSGAKITQWVTNITTVMNSLIKTIDWRLIGTTIGDTLTTISNTVGVFMDTFDFEQLGSSLADMFDGIVDSVDAESVGAALAAPVAAITRTLDGLLTRFEQNGTWGKIGTKLGQTVNGWFNSINWTTVGSNITKGVDGIVTAFSAFLTTTNWEQIGKGLAEIVNGIFNINWTNVGKAISGSASSILTMFTSLFKSVEWSKLGSSIIQLIMGVDWPTLFAKAATLVGTLVTGLLDALIGAAQELDVAELVKTIVSSIVNWFTNIPWAEYTAKLAEFAGALVGKLVKAVVDLAIDLKDFVKNLIDNIKAKIKEKKQEWDEAGKSIWEGVAEGIWNAIKNVGTWIKEHIFDPFINGFKKAFGIASPSKEMKTMGGYLIDGLKEGVSGIWDKIKEKFTEMLTKIKDWFTTKKEDLQKAWDGFKEGITELAVNFVEKISDWLHNIIDWFKAGGEQAKKLLANIAGKVTDFMRKVLNFFTEAGEKTKDFVANIAASLVKWVETVIDWFLDTGDATKNLIANITTSIASGAKKIIDWIFGKDTDADHTSTQKVQLDSGGETKEYEGLKADAIREEKKKVKLDNGGNTSEYDARITNTQDPKNSLKRPVKLDNGGNTPDYDARIKNTQDAKNSLKRPVKLDKGGTTTEYDSLSAEAAREELKKVKLDNGGNTPDYDARIKNTQDAKNSLKRPVKLDKGGTTTEYDSLSAEAAREELKKVKLDNGGNTSDYDARIKNTQDAKNALKRKVQLDNGGNTSAYDTRIKNTQDAKNALKRKVKFDNGGTTTSYDTKLAAIRKTIYTKAQVTDISVDSTALSNMKSKFNSSATIKAVNGKMVATFAARGGIIQNPVIAGEAGREAIIPLEHHTEWINKVADGLMARLKLSNLKIPQLALGKVLPTNSEFLQTHSQSTSNAMSLSMLEQALDNVFSRYMNQFEQPVYVQLNGKTIAEAVRYENNLRAKQLV